MAFLGNFLILVVLHKVSSLHPPSKLLQRCLETTDRLVSIVSQPFIAPYWMSLVHKEWYLCRFAYKATYITAYMHYVQCGQTSSPEYRPVQNTWIQVFKDTATRKWSDSLIRNVCSDKRCYTYSISSLRLLLKVSEGDSVSWLSLKYQVT